MKITILTEGGKKTGFGHVTRCSALYDAFTELNEAPELIIRGDPSVTEILGTRQSVLEDWIPGMDRIVKENREGILVMDSYLAEPSVYSAVSEGVRTPVFFDDNKRIDFQRGTVINGAVGAETMGYQKKEGLQFLLGPAYTPLRGAFWDVESQPLQKDIGRALILTGGSDTGGLTQRIVEYLAGKHPQWQIHVVSSGSMKYPGKRVTHPDICG